MPKLTEEQTKLLQRLRAGESPLKRIDRLGTEIFLPGRGEPIRALLYRPAEGAGPLPVFFDLHGGGFAHGMPEWDDRFCAELASRAGILVLSLDYRLAPEHPFPAALHELCDAVLHVYNNPEAFGADPQRFAMGGHSSGGNLTAALCLFAKRTGAFSLRCQVLDYPPLDLSATDSLPGQAGSVQPEITELYNACYCKPEELTDPLVSPLKAAPAELAGQPPALILAGGLDTLRKSGRQYAGLLQSAGVNAEYREYANMPHGFTIAAFSPLVNPGHKSSRRLALETAGEAALTEICTFLRRYL